MSEHAQLAWSAFGGALTKNPTERAMSAEEKYVEEVDAAPPPPPAALAESLDDALEADRNGGPTPTALSETEPSKESSSSVLGGGEKEYYCGCGPWHPAQLQVFRDARVFTFLMCLFATIEGALVSGIKHVP